MQNSQGAPPPGKEKSHGGGKAGMPEEKAPEPAQAPPLDEQPGHHQVYIWLEIGILNAH